MSVKGKFGRELSYRPLMTSTLWGLFFTLVFLPVFAGVKLGYSLVVGIAVFLFVSLVSFPNHLSLQYGFWEVTDQAVLCYDYDRWGDRVKAVFMPHQVSKRAIKFDAIEKVEVINGPKVIKSKNIFAIFYAPEFYLPWLRTQKYVQLTLTDGQQVKLDLSWDEVYQKESGKQIQTTVAYLDHQIIGG